MPRYDVFLSHANADKPAVEYLAHKLRDEGIEPFLDKWHLIPGEPWQEALEEALDQSRTCAVFLGKTLGPWQNEEMRSALETRVRDGGFRVIPVLLTGGREPGKEDLPRFLRRLTWVDFRDGLDDAAAFRRLLAGIKGKPPGPGSGGRGGPHSLLDGYRCMAPAREPFVQRGEYVKVRDALLAEGTGNTTTVGITTAIHGAGGFGKTALAIELCYDERVREKYPDGILWVQMRDTLEDDGRLKEIRDVIRLWTKEEPPGLETVAKARKHLIELLNGKRVLLVVDDVWRSQDVTPFQGLGPRATLLFTTRDSRTLRGESVQFHVDAMEVPEAVRLLGASLPSGAEAELKTLAALLGEWPLLLKIVSRQVSSWISKGLDLREAIHRAENALKARGLTYFDPKDAKERSQASALTLEVSLERLSPEEQKRFTELAIFPEDTNVPLAVLEKLWQLDPLDVEEFASRLFDLSLLRNFDLRSGTIRLHDVIRAYLLKKGESHLAKWHRRLLDACRPASGRWPDLPRDESYLWNHLVHHLIGAGQSGHCRSLLLDFQYLRSKLTATDVNALLADYAVFAEKETELRLVRDALQLSAHVLARHPNELSGQLLGRLLDRREMGIRSLLQATVSSGTPWLRPRAPCLTRPGGALIRIIEHPGSPNALAVLPEGRVVSGSSDGTLRVWDVEGGQTLQTLQGHSGGVSAVAVLDSRRMVSGSDDGTLRVWDVKRGQTLQTLEGHSSAVFAVAVLDSRRVVSASSGRTLRVWDVESGQTLQILEGHPWITAVAVLNGRRVISGSSDGMLRVWDVESGQTLQILEGHSGWVSAVAVLDSCRVVSASSDGMLRVWDMESGQTLQTLEGHFGRISAVAVLDSRRVVSASDRTLRVWDVESGQTSQTLEGPSSSIHAVAVLNTRWVVSATNDEKLRVWDVESGQTLQTLEGHSDEVSAVAVLDSRRVVSASWDGKLRVWDVESGQTLQTFQGHSNRVNAVAVLDSRRLVSGSDDKTLRVWDVESGQTLQTLQGHSVGVGAVAVLDSRRVVSASWDETLRVWDVESGQTLQTLQGHSDIVYAVAALDSRRLVSGSNDGTLRVWDVESGQTLQTLQGHSDGVSEVAVLDSRRVVSASCWDGTLRVWDVKSGEVECLFTLDAPVTAVAVIPDRHAIVAGDESGRVHFFDFVELTDQSHA